MGNGVEVEVIAWVKERNLVVVRRHEAVHFVDSWTRVDGYRVDMPVTWQRLDGVEGAGPETFGLMIVDPDDDAQFEPGDRVVLSQD